MPRVPDLEIQQMLDRLWIRYGICGRCGRTAWVWLNGRGYGPHMRWECCLHMEKRMRRLAKRNERHAA